MEWFDYSIPLCLPGGLDSNKFNALECMFDIQIKDELLGEDWLKCFATEILDAKYKKRDVVKVMKGLTHLNAHQKADLLWVLQENKKMFNETLDIIYMKRLSKKEDNRACWISTSCQLNKVKRQKQYPLPIIMDILRKRSRYKFSLNLTIVCNTIRLSLTSKVKTPVPSSHHLVNTSTWDSWWDSNALQTLLKQSWKMHCQKICEFI